MDETTGTFHIEEYRALRAEMLYLFKEINDSFRFYLTGISAIIAWLLTLSPPRPDDVWLRIASAWIPCVLVIILSISTARSAASVRNIGNYLLRLEDHFGVADLGWQKAGERRDFRHKIRFSAFHGYINTVLFLATLAVAISITCHLYDLAPGDLLGTLRAAFFKSN
ncbi:MAG TPA: hypothetical protein VG839_08065 [Asticcacaulis sp.]|nr:hypothetical protein [Asticcacaulis sp.]